MIQPSALGVNGFYNLFKNPINGSNQEYKTGAAGIAVSYQKGFSQHLTFNTSLNGSILDFVNRNNVDIGNEKKQLLLEFDISSRYLFITNDHIAKPYFQAGIGGSVYSGYWGVFIPIGVGLQLNISPSTFILMNIQKRIAITNNQDDHYYFSIGLAGNIGRQNNVKSKKTLLPSKDSDGDGIYDTEDACPLVPGVIKYKGCPIPDRDGDGINDEEDNCPDVPGILKYAGCPIPDRDKDGINDEIDQCPDVPGYARYKGCPIPDRDHDTLNDEEDNCPDQPGPISNKGCPIITREIINKVNRAAKNCFFETGRFNLLPASFQSLNEVIIILNADTSLHLIIEGHTDNIGKETDNKILSKNRAEAVLFYLSAKGISIQRLQAEGYGQSKPVASNLSSSGRTQNRRVEMKLIIGH